MKLCVILGGGGHAKVVLDALGWGERIHIVGLLVPDREQGSARELGLPVLGNDDLLSTLPERGITHFVIGLAGVGPGEMRAGLFNRAMHAGLQPFDVMHPKAIVSARAIMGSGAQVLAGAVVNAGASLGAGCIINSGAIVEHDANLGDFVHVACGACVAGGVSIGRAAFVGAGATIIQGVRVGDGALIGAGAVVISDVPCGSRVVGVPARVLG